MYKESRFSRKISFINFILSIMIVMLHSSCKSYAFSIDNYILVRFFEFIKVFCDSAVPLFFLISAYLFFKNLNMKNYFTKFKKRCKSLLLPYLVWGFLSFIIFYIVNIILKKQSIFLLGNIEQLLMARYNPPLWFIRTLFIFVLISPIIYFFIKSLKKFSLLIPIIFVILNCIYKFSYSEMTSILFWLPTLFYGAYLVVYNNKMVENKIYSKRISIISITLLFLLSIFISYCDEKSILYYLYRILSPMLLWIGFDIIDYNKIIIKDYMNYTFFTFCIHYPITYLLKEVLFKLFGISEVSIIIIFMMTFILAFIISYLIGYILKKYFNKIWLIFNGGR